MPTEYRLGRLNKRWVVSWWGEDGKRRRHRLEDTVITRAEAEAAAIDKIREVVVAPKGRLVADLWEAYRREKQGRRVAVAMGHEWKAVGAHFGHLRPDQVTTDIVRAYTTARRAKGKHDGTIWTELGHLRTVLVWALGRDKAPKIERPAKPAPRERYLTRAECERLIQAATQHHIRLAILLMLSTAGRVGAILELRWDRVDLERGQINLRTDDTGPRKGRAVVPINDGLRAALEHARRASLTDHVIEWAGEPVKSIRTGFNIACANAGLDVSPHDLRRTAARMMVEAGIPMSEVAQYLGHSNVQVTFSTYGRFSPTHLRRAADVLDFTTIKARAG